MPHVKLCARSWSKKFNICYPNPLEAYEIIRKADPQTDNSNNVDSTIP